MIYEIMYTVQCDHPGCTRKIKFPIVAGKTSMENLRALGWQPWNASDYCPEHHKEDE